MLKVSDLGFLILGEERVDIRMLHDIATLPQMNAIAFLLRKLIGQVNPLERYQIFQGSVHTAPKWINRQAEVERLVEEVSGEGLESAYAPFFHRMQPIYGHAQKI